VRELFAALESAHIQAGGRRIEAQHLPADVRGMNGPAATAERYRLEQPSEHERDAIARALTETGGARSAAAEQFRMSRTTLWRKMKEYGLQT
jgi:transcriptional regulator of acetoin/glycerol metabolism